MKTPNRVIVIGTSTGGLEALKAVLSGLPANFPGAVLVAMHVGSHPSALPRLLGTNCALAVRHAQHLDRIEPGSILIAPPDKHLIVDGQQVRLSHGAKENHSRPAIDPLFRSAAMSFGSKTIGVILTGDLDDGTVGLQAIEAHGGQTIVQDPLDAVAPSMPLSAIEYVRVDFILPLAAISDTLVDLVQQSDLPEPATMGTEDKDASTQKSGASAIESMQAQGELSPFTCPECHGALWLMNPHPEQYRCHTGHTYTAQTMAAAQDRGIEEAIWAAVRALNEKEALLNRFTQEANKHNRDAAASEYLKTAEQVRRNAEVLRGILVDGGASS